MQHVNVIFIVGRTDNHTLWGCLQCGQSTWSIRARLQLQATAT